MKQVNMLLFIIFIVLAIFAEPISAYTYCGYKWASPSTSWSFDSSFPTAYYTAVKNADYTWDNAGSKFRFNYNYPSNNKIYWTDNLYNKNAVAEAPTWLSGSTITQMAIKFNNKKSWTNDCIVGPVMIDVESIALHEFGHWLCLTDEYDIWHFDHAMYYSYNYYCKRGLNGDDKSGIIGIYGR